VHVTPSAKHAPRQISPATPVFAGSQRPVRHSVGAVHGSFAGLPFGFGTPQFAPVQPAVPGAPAFVLPPPPGVVPAVPPAWVAVAPAPEAPLAPEAPPAPAAAPPVPKTTPPPSGVPAVNVPVSEPHAVMATTTSAVNGALAFPNVFIDRVSYAACVWAGRPHEKIDEPLSGSGRQSGHRSRRRRSGYPRCTLRTAPWA
jgi:hypothetical protein